LVQAYFYLRAVLNSYHSYHETFSYLQSSNVNFWSFFWVYVILALLNFWVALKLFMDDDPKYAASYPMGILIGVHFIALIAGFLGGNGAAALGHLVSIVVLAGASNALGSNLVFRASR